MADPGGCRVVNLPQRIWLLGGVCNASTESPGSSRDWFLRKTLSIPSPPDWVAHLERPEDYPGWLEFSGYGDLLEFERDACYLARASILFAESPGAFSELGALAIDPSLRERLAVVVDHPHTTYNARASFLNLGPLRRVNESAKIIVGPAPAGTNGQLSDSDVSSIAESISDWLAPLHKSEKLRVRDPRHRLLLIADLVDLLLASKLEEIIEALNHFGVEMDAPSTLAALNLLSFLQLVLFEKHGGAPYWLRRDASKAPWVDYTSMTDQPYDRSRFKIKALEAVGGDPRKRTLMSRPQS